MALNKDKIFKNADKYIRANKIEKAIHEYETWLKANPKDWNTVRQVGDLYSRIGRNDEAIKKYSLVAEHFKRDGFNVRAIATHKMILRLDAGNEAAMRNLAELQAEEGLLMEAKSHYQTLVELYAKQGHKRRAAEVFKKLTEIDPQDVKIRYKFAEFLAKQGKADDAAEEYVGIADQFICQGLVDEAIKILEQGRALATSNPSLKIKLAHAHSLQGNHAQAVKMLEEVRNAHPNDAGVIAKLGEAYLAAGNNAKAESAFLKFQELKPNDPGNAVRLAELRIAQSQLDAALDQLTPLVDRRVAENDSGKAAALLSKVLAKDPYHVKTLLKLAEVHTILKQDGARVSAYDSLCEAYSRAGEFDKAVQVAEQLVELDPESSQHKDRLNFLKGKLAGPAAEPRPRAPAVSPGPELQLDQDMPGIGDIDLGAAVADSFEEELAVEGAAPAPATAGPDTAPPSVDLGEMVELTSEDEENIKEKLTEAEVFVRYGLVDKAIAQLLDVLESFRYHVESREKLIEIYKDQGMTREASEQLLQMAQVYERQGEAARGAKAREEAAQLNPALAAETASADLAAQEELELTLAPETDSDLGEVGLEIDVPPVSGDVAMPSPDAEPLLEAPPPAPEEIAFHAAGADLEVASEEGAELEIALDDGETEVSLEESVEDIPVDVDLGEDVDLASSGIDIGGEIGAPESEVSLSGIDDEDVVEEVVLSADNGLEEVGDGVLETGSAADDEDIEIDLDADSEDIPFDISATAETEPEPEVAVPEASELASAHDDATSGLEASNSEIEISFDEMEAESFDAAEVGAELDSVEELAVEMPGDAPELDEGVEEDLEEELIPPDLGLGAEEYGEEAAGEDIEIDIPSVDEITTAGGGEAAAAEPVPPVAPVSSESTPLAGPVPPRTEPPAVASELAAELAEVDEYIALGLYEDARDTLRELSSQHPEEASIRAKLEELGFSADAATEELESAAPVADVPGAALSDSAFDAVDDGIGIEALVAAPEPAPAASGDELVDLASELSDEIFGTQSVLEDEEDEPEGPLTDPGLDQIFKEFRKGVEKQLGTEDYDTRYNLGIAYKEMGLLDEAIAEFQLAAKDELRNLECCSMLGLCFMEKGMPDIAIKWFAKGLALPGRREEEYHGLRYDLAQAYEAASQLDRALELYTEIFKENARFRDVKDRVRELSATLK